MRFQRVIFVFSFLICSAAFAQSSFLGLLPGKSARSDVERLLGQPLRVISETLCEYKAEEQTAQVFVQYRKNSSLIERIEVINSDTVERSGVIRLLNLSDRAIMSQTNRKGGLEEYFENANVVLTYASADPGSGVSRIGYYSPELFKTAIEDIPRSQNPIPTPTANPPAIENSKSSSAGLPGRIVGLWRMSDTGSVIEIMNDGTAFYREVSESSKSYGYELNDLALSDLRPAGNHFEAKITQRPPKDSCPAFETLSVKASITVLSEKTFSLTAPSMEYQINEGRCSWTGRVYETIQRTYTRVP